MISAGCHRSALINAAGGATGVERHVTAVHRHIHADICGFGRDAVKWG